MNIEQLALRAGFSVEESQMFANSEIGPMHALCTASLTRFAALVRAQALEDVVRKLDRCADGDWSGHSARSAALACAAAIRALA